MSGTAFSGNRLQIFDRLCLSVTLFTWGHRPALNAGTLCLYVHLFGIDSGHFPTSISALIRLYWLCSNFHKYCSHNHKPSTDIYLSVCPSASVCLHLCVLFSHFICHKLIKRRKRGKDDCYIEPKATSTAYTNMQNAGFIPWLITLPCGHGWHCTSK